MVLLLEDYKREVQENDILSFVPRIGVPFPTGIWESGNYSTVTDPTLKQACKVGYFGWYSKYGDYAVDGGILDDSWATGVRLDYVFTQQMIWEVLGQDYATFRDGTIQAQYETFKADINAKISNMQTRPSFETQAIEMNVGETKTITDNNNVLKDYQSIDRTINGIRFQHTQGENTLTITINNDCNVERYYLIDKIAKEWGLIKAESADHDTSIYFDFGGGLQNQLYAMNYNDPIPLALNLKINAKGNLEVTKNAEDGKIEGLQFHLYGTAVNGTNINEYATTDNAGKARFNDILISGASGYTVEEVGTPNKYITPITQNVTIIANETTTTTFSNVLKRGKLEVTKTSEDGMIEGIKFHLYGTSLSGSYVNEYAITDSKGKAKFENVLISNNQGYTLEEIDTAIKYVIPAKLNVSVKWNDVTKATINNKLKKFRVTVTKSDIEKGVKQGDGTLAGAVYGIYDNGKLIDTYTTDNKGQFTTKYYICGDKWTIREITPSEGYLLNNTSYSVGAEAKKYTIEYNTISNNVTEQVIKGKMSIIKHSDNGDTGIETPEVGAEFQIYLKSAGSYNSAKLTEKDTIVCDENGYAETKLLPYGIYTVHQTKGWEDREFIKDFDVYIAQDGKIYRYIINNAYFESYVKVIKKDSETGKIIPMAGIGFQIYNYNKELVTMTYTYPNVTTVDTFYTGTDGTLVTPQKLGVGNYYLKEVQAPYGYVINQDYIPFTIKQENGVEDDKVTVVEVVASNKAQKGTITINKTGEIFNSVTNNNNTYQPIYNISNLAGAVYQIIADENIYTGDGTLRNEKGSIVDTITTNGEGKATSKEVYLGKYIVKEITAPDGMVINNDSYNVELTYAGQNVELTSTTTSFYNERQKVEIDVKKSLEVDNEYNIGNNGEFLDVTFGLYAKEEITAQDGSMIPQDGLIEIIGINEKGKGTFKTDLPFGKYYIQEIATNNAYIVNDTKYPVEFNYQGQEKAIVTITANEDKDIINKIIRGKVEGIKLDEDIKELESATIGIFKKDTTEFTIKNAIKTTISNKDGSFSFIDVPFGEWIIKEIQAPYGFVLSEEKFLININEQNQVIQIELVNEYIKGNITLTKVDKEYPDNCLTGATFEIYQDTNESEILDKEDKVIGNLEEMQEGIYSQDNLRYGKYFIKETVAPQGFILDENIYTVNITENGKTYEIENEAGIGFINQAEKGNIKIKKTSSDGKLDGFSFSVVGTDVTGKSFNQTYITDENGEIFIDGLRIGKYTITELSNEENSQYIIPDSQTVTIENEKTAEVQFYNQLIEIPQTGGKSNIALWISLLGVSIITLIGIGIYENKKRRSINKNKN